MKRKILSLALIAALVFALSVSAFAADVASGTGDEALDKLVEAVVKNPTEASQGDIVKTVEKVTEITEEFTAKDFYAKNTEAAEDVAKIIDKVAAGKKVEDSKVKLVDAFEFNATDAMKAAVAKGETVEVEFTKVNVSASDTVIVMHQKADGTWEVLDAYVKADGTVVAKFTGFSPVTISILTVTYSNDTTTTTPSTDTTVKSPQTSDIG